jgi:polyisoprenoid-binding protein YceI
MSIFRVRIRRIGLLAVAWSAIFLSDAAPQPRLQTEATRTHDSELVLILDPAQSQVHWTVDTTLHTVHGTFALKSGTLHLDPNTGKAGGEILVIGSSGESGNNSRDSRMHKEILETPKYPDVIFRPTQLEGTVKQSGTSDVKLTGIFSIHGADHPLTAQIHAEFTGHRWKASGTFQVPYVQWGIKDPSNFLLKVQPVVDVEMEMSGDVKTTE